MNYSTAPKLPFPCGLKQDTPSGIVYMEIGRARLVTQAALQAQTDRQKRLAAKKFPRAK
jgi:hypothetical protein